MKISPTLIVFLAVVLSVGSAGAMLWLNYDAIFKPKPVIKAEFTSVEFDADDTRIHTTGNPFDESVSKELTALKEGS